MRAVGGTRPAAIAPCELHGSGSLLLSCAACCTWWRYREALRTADYWRGRYQDERAARIAAERKNEAA